MSNNIFYIYSDGTGSYPIAELQAVYAKLRQGLQAADYGATFSLLGDDGNTYNFFNNLPTPPAPEPSPDPNQNNNYPNFIPVVQFEGFTPATPTSNTTSYASETTIILIISTVVLSAYYYKTKYSR
jgi:hypothetical protein